MLLYLSREACLKLFKIIKAYFRKTAEDDVFHENNGNNGPGPDDNDGNGPGNQQVNNRPNNQQNIPQNNNIIEVIEQEGQQNNNQNNQQNIQQQLNLNIGEEQNQNIQQVERQIIPTRLLGSSIVPLNRPLRPDPTSDLRLVVGAGTGLVLAGVGSIGEAFAERVIEESALTGVQQGVNTVANLFGQSNIFNQAPFG
jgi:hypothetical protein